MCFSSPTPDPVTTSTVAAAPPPPAPGALQQPLGTGAKAQNVADFGNADGPQTRVNRSATTPATSATSGVNTNYRM